MVTSVPDCFLFGSRVNTHAVVFVRREGVIPVYVMTTGVAGTTPVFSFIFADFEHADGTETRMVCTAAVKSCYYVRSVHLHGP